MKKVRQLHNISKDICHPKPTRFGRESAKTNISRKMFLITGLVFGTLRKSSRGINIELCIYIFGMHQPTSFRLANPSPNLSGRLENKHEHMSYSRAHSRCRSMISDYVYVLFYKFVNFVFFLFVSDRRMQY